MDFSSLLLCFKGANEFGYTEDGSYGENPTVIAKTDAILSEYCLLEREIPKGNADIDLSVACL